MSDDSPPFWFAIWNVRANFAYALDAYPEELKPYERSLRSGRRAWDDNFTGSVHSKRKTLRLRSWWRG